MKTKVWKINLAFALILIGCNKPQQEPAQAVIRAIDSPQNILAYANSIDRQTGIMQKQQSYLYSSGSYSFSVSSYTLNKEPSLLIEQGRNSEEQRSTEIRIYLREGRPVLLLEKVLQEKPYRHIVLKRSFFQKDTLLIAESKQANGEAELNAMRFMPAPPGSLNLKAELNKLNSALAGKGRFDLNFEEVIDYPLAKYIVLSREGLNAYRAILRIMKEDELTRSLSSDPQRYRGRKLNLNWKFGTDKQMLYISGNLH